jgi:YHS domain-containing protein
MFTRRKLFALVMITTPVFLMAAGCSSEPPKSPPPTTSAAEDSADKDIAEALAKLSEADRAAAIKQEICPVTGMKLGSMDVPPKITVEGKEVFLCCEGCEGKLREDPATYLAKLKSK